MHKRGMFWIVDGELLAAPYSEDEKEKMSTNSSPYTQSKLWERVRPDHNFKKYNYYPRGIVTCDSNGKPVIILGKSVKKSFKPKIQEAFEITDEPHVVRDRLKRYDSEEDRAKDRAARRKSAKKTRRIDTL